jgi:hypothetical protein
MDTNFGYQDEAKDANLSLCSRSLSPYYLADQASPGKYSFQLIPSMLLKGASESPICHSLDLPSVAALFTYSRHKTAKATVFRQIWLLTRKHSPLTTHDKCNDKPPTVSETEDAPTRFTNPHTFSPHDHRPQALANN